MRHLPFYLLLFLSGCAFGPKVGPGYERPSMALPESWKTAPLTVAEGPVAAVYLPDSWWQLFEDEKLNELEALALDANRNLKAALQRLEQARAQRRSTAADFWPTVTLTPSISRFRTPSRVLGGGLVTDGFTSERYSADGIIHYELDLWGKLRRSYQRDDHLFQASAEDYRAAMLTITTDIAVNYFLLRELDSEIEILTQTIALRDDALGLVQSRADKGLVSKLDVARARTELASAEKELLGVLRQRHETENTLAILCGQPASEFTLEKQPLRHEVPRAPIYLPAQLLERRPDVLRLEEELKAAVAEIGRLQALRLPAFSVDIEGGFENPESNLVFDSRSRKWAITPRIDWTIFPTSRGSAAVEEATALAEEAVADYERGILIAVSEVETRLNDLKTLAEEAEVHDRLLSAARETAELSSSRYRQGLDDYLVVTDAERQRLLAELEAVRILSQRLITTATLIQALGGGWETSEKA